MRLFGCAVGLVGRFLHAHAFVADFDVVYLFEQVEKGLKPIFLPVPARFDVFAYGIDMCPAFGIFEFVECFIQQFDQCEKGNLAAEHAAGIIGAELQPAQIAQHAGEFGVAVAAWVKVRMGLADVIADAPHKCPAGIFVGCVFDGFVEQVSGDCVPICLVTAGLAMAWADAASAAPLSGVLALAVVEAAEASSFLARSLKFSR